MMNGAPIWAPFYVALTRNAGNLPADADGQG